MSIEVRSRAVATYIVSPNGFTGADAVLRLPVSGTEAVLPCRFRVDLCTDIHVV